VAGGCARYRVADGGDGLRSALPTAPGINILVVSFDALRADRLSVHGYPRPTSPHIDQLAREAVVFEHAWSAAQSTPTSFAGMFTGRWPSRVFRGWQLEPVPTIASAFAAGGYHTAFLSTNVQLVASRHFGQGFYDYEILTADPVSDSDSDNIADDEYLLSRARRWLRKEARPPFLLWVHFLSPHSPYAVQEGSDHFYRSAGGRFATTTGHSFTVESEAELERVRDLYDGEVFFADGLFAGLLEALREGGHDEDTLVALTSDHGEELMDHGGLQHGKVFEEVIRVPLILRHPRGRALRSDLPASGVDLFPTLAGIAGLEVPEGLDGVSLLEPVAPDRLRLALAMTHRTDNYVGIGSGDEKLILDCRRGSAMLFDLAADPAERIDRLEERRRSYAELEAAAAEELGGDPCAQLAAAIAGVPAASALDAETQARLLSIGYLGGGADGTDGGDLLWAEPHPIRVCDGLMLGQTVLHWSLHGYDGYELRVDDPSGGLLGKVGPKGALPTGRWVRDGMTFFAVGARDGRVLATTAVAVTADGCPGRPGPPDAAPTPLRR
jgi:arylsulfatase